MGETFYLVDLSQDVRKRHYHRTERGTVVDFVVQLEIRMDGQWREAIRYDCAHGYPHCDRYNLHGEKRTDDLQITDLKRALTLADQDVNRHWEVYRQRFLEGAYP